MAFPFISFIIPTLNAEEYLEKCLHSIRKQKYPKNKYEILLIDGGSKDKTLEIGKNYDAKIISNPLVDQESGKSIGISHSNGGTLVLMDADNEIKNRDWLRKMIKPLVVNQELFGVESYYFSRKTDNIFNKYCMTIHIADPFSRMIAARLIEDKKKGYTEYEIPPGTSYPLGANGFLWRKSVIEKVGFYKPKFEESNFSFFAMEKGYRKFARVPNCGIYHYHINGFADFIKKRLKIGNKYLNRKDEKKRTWLEGVSRPKFIVSLIYSLTFIGPFFESLVNYFKFRKNEWLLHPLMSFTSVTIYAYVFLRRRLRF